MKQGIHIHKSVPNLDELLWTFGDGTYVGTHYDLPTLAEIKRRQPEATIIPRWHHGDVMSQPGTDAAQELADWLLSDAGYGFAPITVARLIIPANELNLQGEHGNDGNQDYWDSQQGHAEIDFWYTEFLDEGHRLLPYMKFIGPCHSPQGLYQLAWMPNSMPLWDAYGIHLYGTQSIYQTIDAHFEVGGIKDVYITECNQLDYPLHLELCDKFDRIKAFCWFLWTSPDLEFQHLQMAVHHRNWLLAIKEYREKKEAVMLKDQLPVEYRQWLADGGDPEEAFRFYCQATDRIPVGYDDFIIMCKRLQAHLHELIIVAERLLPKA